MIKILTLNKLKLKDRGTGTSLVVQWLRLYASTAGDTGLIPGWETKILHAILCHRKKKKRFKRNNQTCPLNSLKYLLLLFGHCETGEIPVGLRTSDLIVLPGHRPSPEAPQQNCLIREKAEELNSDPIPSPKLKMMKKRSHHFTKIPQVSLHF